MIRDVVGPPSRNAGVLLRRCRATMTPTGCATRETQEADRKKSTARKKDEGSQDRDILR